MFLNMKYTHGMYFRIFYGILRHIWNVSIFFVAKVVVFCQEFLWNQHTHLYAFSVIFTFWSFCLCLFVCSTLNMCQLNSLFTNSFQIITYCQVESVLFLWSKFGKQESQLTSKLHVTCVEMSWLKFSCITSSRTLLTSYERQHCRSTSALWSWFQLSLHPLSLNTWQRQTTWWTRMSPNCR